MRVPWVFHDQVFEDFFRLVPVTCHVKFQGLEIFGVGMIDVHSASLGFLKSKMRIAEYMDDLFFLQ